MFHTGDVIVYGVHGVCTVIGMEIREASARKVRYYVLQPKEQPDARYYVPADNPSAVAKLRKLMRKDQVNRLLAEFAQHGSTWIVDENTRKQHYRSLMSTADIQGIFSMIHALHAHRQQLASAGRKFYQCDENFLKDAEKLLGAELAEVLEIPENQVGDYVRTALENQ